MNIATNNTGLIVMVSESAMPTPPAGGASFTLTNGQRTAFQALVGAPNGGITFDGSTFVALPFVPPPPFDYSNFDNLDKTLKAVGLVVRSYTNGLLAGTYTNKTIAQVKADYLSAYNSL